MGGLLTDKDYNRFTANNDEPIRDKPNRDKEVSLKGMGYWIFLIFVFLITYLLFSKYYFV